MRSWISADFPFLRLLFLDAFPVLNEQKLRCALISLPSLSWYWGFWHDTHRTHDRFQQLDTSLVCVKIQINPWSISSVFSIWTIPFLMECGHFSVLVMRKTHHIWGAVAGGCISAPGGWIHPWGVLLRDTMNPVGGNDCHLGELSWTWYYFPCLMNHLKFYGTLWGEKRQKRRVKKHANRRSSHCVIGEKITKWTDYVWTSIFPKQLQIINHCLCYLALKTRLMQKPQEENVRPPHRSEWYHCKEQRDAARGSEQTAQL